VRGEKVVTSPVRNPVEGMQLQAIDSAAGVARK
jgi:hypothetical protein